MKTITTFSYTIKNDNQNIVKELQYSDYANKNNEEIRLLYKNILDHDQTIESFNKLKKSRNEVNEIIGNSRNKKPWQIQEYKNSLLQREYKTDYDSNSFNINHEMIEKIYEKNKYIKDKID
jgi:hypothetical protein